MNIKDTSFEDLKELERLIRIEISMRSENKEEIVFQVFNGVNIYSITEELFPSYKEKILSDIEHAITTKNKMFSIIPRVVPMVEYNEINKLGGM